MFVRTDCDYPLLYNQIVFYYTISMVVLFSHFYYFTYVRQRQHRAASGEKKKKTENNNGLKNGPVGQSSKEDAMLSSNGHARTGGKVADVDVRNRKR